MAEPHDVRGHFPYHEYPHPNDHTHAAVAEPLTLTPDEQDALRAILAMLATIGERGFLDDRQLCEITWQTWNDMLLRPAQRLVRVAPQRRLGGGPPWLSR